MGMGVGRLPPGLLWSRGLVLNTNHDLTSKYNAYYYKRFRKIVCHNRKYVDLLLKTGDILQKNNSFNDDDYYYSLFFIFINIYIYIYITLLF